jgi:hypothetical protein
MCRIIKYYNQHICEKNIRSLQGKKFSDELFNWSLHFNYFYNKNNEILKRKLKKKEKKFFFFLKNNLIRRLF